MGWFTKEAIDTVPEPTLDERIAAAEIAVQDANQRIADANKAVADLQAQHNLSFDQFGRITRCMLPGGEVQSDLAQELRLRWERRTVAIQNFHQALKQWSGLKGL